MAYEIDVRTVPARTLAAFRFHVTHSELTQMGEKMGSAFGRVMAALGAAGVAPVGPPVASYERAEDGFDVAAGFPTSTPVTATDGVASLELPAAEVAHTTHVGPYEDLPKAYDALQTEARARGRELDQTASMWEEYLTGPDVPPEQMRTEVYWPLAAEGPTRPTR
jgi:effector-binding domain-containing protein